MYCVVTWDIDAGTRRSVSIEAEAIEACGGRLTCEIYRGVRIVRISSTTDFMLVHEALARVESDHVGLFRYAAWALRSGSPMRSSVGFDRELAREVIVG
jgi:hypothetical protein